MEVPSEFGVVVLAWFAAKLVPVRGWGGVDLEAPWVDGNVSEIAVSESTLLPNCDVDGAR